MDDKEYSAWDNAHTWIELQSFMEEIQEIFDRFNTEGTRTCQLPSDTCG